MKTVYSIGRDPGCDIYLFDDKNLISRTHAILKVGNKGRYFISDQSMNGTYINGIRISTGVPVPVTRKDVVTFAHVAELDWNQIPKRKSSAWKIILFIFLGLFVLAGGAFGVVKVLEHYRSTIISIGTDMVTSEPVFDETESDKMKEREDARTQAILEWEERVKAEEQKRQAKAKAKKAKAEAEPKKAKAETEPKQAESADKDVRQEEMPIEENKNYDPIL